MKADTVWLLVHNNRAEDNAGRFEEKIRDRLGAAGIEIKTEYADRKSLFGILCAVRGIIAGDEGKNDIYVNVSSGSKIQAIACMMACMMWNDTGNLTPYYAEPEEYSSSKSRLAELSSGLKEITELPRYSIQIPREKLVGALRIVREWQGWQDNKERACRKGRRVGNHNDKLQGGEPRVCKICKPCKEYHGATD